ncbi:MAG TPA: prepilin-type N-terminal cleavage/methylation domain-containing protein [Thermoanaerobaculia bacterium]|nr:prepilin-type N-terminal cleavage/methylation domain-containing protein [Thermoanaerobaculia bacterium]
MEKHQRGQTLIELLVTVSVIACLGAAGTITVNRSRRAVGLAAVTSELRAVVQRTRITAITHNRNVAIRFRPSADTWSVSIYEDGDGDGVRNDDIAAGIDRLIEPPRLIRFPPARIGTPSAAIPDPATGAPLSARSPVRFGSSQLCSFTRRGEVTNGSIVVTDDTTANVVRVHGTSGQIDVERWNGAKWITGD